MKPLKRTCLLLALLFALSPWTTNASPEVTTFQCALEVRLDVGGAIDEPVGRWVGEFADMTKPVIRYAQWPDGESLRVDVTMGEVKAFDWTIVIEGRRACMMTSLAPDKIFLCDEGQYRCVQDVVDEIVCAVYPDGSTDEWVSDGDKLADGFARLARKMRMWPKDDTAEAFAQLFETFEKKFRGSDALMRVTGAYTDADSLTLQTWPAEAEQGARPDTDALLSDMFVSLINAIADNDTEDAT